MEELKVVEVAGGTDEVVLVLGALSISLIFPALVLHPKKNLGTRMGWY